MEFCCLHHREIERERERRFLEYVGTMVALLCVYIYIYISVSGKERRGEPLSS